MVSTRGNNNRTEVTETSEAAGNRARNQFENPVGNPPVTMQMLFDEMRAMQERLNKAEQELATVRAEKDALEQEKAAQNEPNDEGGEEEEDNSRNRSSRVNSDARTSQNDNEGRQRRRFNIKDFTACVTTKFSGDASSVEAHRWLREVERGFIVADCPDRKKVILATQLFRKNAADWWDTQTEILTPEVVNQMNWETFTEMFRKEYFTVRERQVLEREFLSMTKGEKSMKEHVRLFAEKLRFCTRLCPDDVSKVGRFVESIPGEYRSLVRTQETLKAAFDTALSMEDDLKPSGKKDGSSGSKRRNDELEPSNKKIKDGSSNAKDVKEGERWCSECKSRHAGSCSAATRRCHKCGKKGHDIKECKDQWRCFRCDSTDHKISDCPVKKADEKHADHGGRQ